MAQPHRRAFVLAGVAAGVAAIVALGATYAPTLLNPVESVVSIGKNTFAVTKRDGSSRICVGRVPAIRCSDWKLSTDHDVVRSRTPPPPPGFVLEK